MRTLLWLRWRGLLDEATYWFRLIDYDYKDRSMGNRLFTLYLLVFFAWWSLAVLSILSTFAAGFGQLLALSTIAQIQSLAHLGIVIAQIVVWCWCLRTTPLRLSLPDTFYLSNTSSLRTSLALLRFVETVALPLMIGAAVGYFGTLVFFRTTVELLLYKTALLNAALVSLATLATYAIGWALGLARISFPTLRRLPWLWLVPVLLSACLFLQPSPLTAFWQPYVDSLFGISDIQVLWQMPVVFAIVGIFGVALFGRLADMTTIREESAVYAQLQAIGLLRFAIPAIYERAEREIKSVRIKPRLRLPETHWFITLMARSILTFVRQPKLLLQTLSAALLISAGVGISFGQIAPLALITWLYGAMFLPTNGLIFTFRIDIEDHFLRQFLQRNPLMLFAGECAVAIGLTSALSLAGAWSLLVAHGNLVIGAALIVCMTALLAACHGASMLPLTSFHFQPSHGVLVLLAFGTTLGAGLALGSAVAVLGLCVLCLSCLSWLIATSPG